MMVDAVIRQWLTVVEGEEAETEIFGIVVQRLAALKYSDNGIISSPNPAWLNESMGVMTGLFEWFGLNINANKLVGMT